MNGIYAPAEDSFFLSEFVKEEISVKDQKRILDMGSGSGIQSEAAITAGADPNEITLVDNNPLVVSYLKRKFPRSKVVLSDLFTKVSGGFDLIVFNPPYLPEDRFDTRKDISGGKYGGEIINRFLKQAHNYLSKKGKILLLTSSLTRKVKWDGYRRELLGRKKIFFEELYVWSLTL